MPRQGLYRRRKIAVTDFGASMVIEHVRRECEQAPLQRLKTNPRRGRAESESLVLRSIMTEHCVPHTMPKREFETSPPLGLETERSTGSSIDGVGVGVG